MKDGIILQLPTGKPVRVTIHDADMNQLDTIVPLDEGVFAYENANSAVTVALEAPRLGYETRHKIQ